ncbi:MAG TPA: CBS domain-containing protein, partial [Gemmataceae bacterium]|nr:CBS domain-containing protein [Gemmataceae bacterium]
MTADCIASPSRLTLNARTAADLMSRRVVSISEDAPIGEAIATLVDRGFSGLPVVNAAGRAVGVISLSDIVVHDRNRSGYDLPIVVVQEDPTLVRDVMTPAVC